MQEETYIAFVQIVIKVIDPAGIEGRTAALDAVNLVSFRQQQLGKISTVLARYPGN
jgi:hypothetical protein